MGNDGGSIPRRTEMVKTKKKARKTDDSEKLVSKWHYCALSKTTLSSPVVICALGKLYNKEAILEHLINRKNSKYGDGDQICPHIKSMNHVQEINLTDNPNFIKGNKDSSPFICALNQKAMNGYLPFVYLKKCGCAFSKAGLASLESKLLECPLCSTSYTKEDVIEINPPVQVQKEILLKLLEKEKVKNKKRAKEDYLDEDLELDRKKKSIVQQAKEQAQSKPKSKAIQSIFTSSRSNDQVQDTNYLCKGTFNRYS